MAQQKEPTIEDYKKYTRDLKEKIKRLQDKNKDLLNENSSLKDRLSSLPSSSGKQSNERVNFAIGLNSKIVKAQVASSNGRRSGE